MAAELEKLARQFLVSGNEDIAEGILSLSAIAKSRGCLTFSKTTVFPTIYPNEAIRLPDLTIGGRTKEQLETMLASEGIIVGNWQKNMLRNPDFTTLPEQQTLSLVKVKVADLGLPGNPTTTQLFARANYLGFGLCPAEVGPQLCLAYKKQPQPIYRWLFLGMKPIAADDEGIRPLIFQVGRLPDGYHLFGHFAEPSTQWPLIYEFVFSISK